MPKRRTRPTKAKDSTDDEIVDQDYGSDQEIAPAKNPIRKRKKPFHYRRDDDLQNENPSSDSDMETQPRKTSNPKSRRKRRTENQPMQQQDNNSPLSPPPTDNQATMNEILSQLKTLQDHVFNKQGPVPSSSVESPAPSTSKSTSLDRKRKSYHEEYDSDSEELSYDNDSDSCSDDEFENFDKPQTSFGSMVDSLVTKKCETKY